jgi:hypothetical protein
VSNHNLHGRRNALERLWWKQRGDDRISSHDSRHDIVNNHYDHDRSYNDHDGSRCGRPNR